MTEPTSRQTRLHELFTAALHLPSAQQEPYLLRSSPDDPALVREVLALLRAADAAPADFLTPPPPPPDPPSFLAKAAPHAHMPYDASKDALPGSRLRGRYTFGARLGEGGMSIVYEGEQDHPRRRVAIKIIRPEYATAKVLRRFRDEPEILAQLNHPNIVRVFEADVEDFGAGDGPQPYFVMEYVDGIPLTQFARDGRMPRGNHHRPTHDRRKPTHDGRLTLRERLELFAIVCDAVQAIHQRGIIHRDLKPSNILVTADGQPKVLDFGVAKVLPASDIPVEHTLTGAIQLIGTLQYMSPEQCSVGLGEPRASARADAPPCESQPSSRAAASASAPRPSGSGLCEPQPLSPEPQRLNPEPQPLNPEPQPLNPQLQPFSPEPRTLNPEPRPLTPQPSLDTRSDVYALGVLLYELLTDRLPYDVSNMTLPSAARAICEAEPTPPSHFDRKLRGDLDCVILKALEKDRTKRYASAAHLAEDLRRYLAGEPVEATAPNRWRRVVHWIGKHPIAATTAACMGMTLLTSIALATSWYYLTLVPYQVRLAYPKGAALVAASGRILHEWPDVLQSVNTKAQASGHLPRIAPLIKCGDRRMAVFILDPPDDERGAGLFFYDTKIGLDKPVHTSFIEPSDDFGFSPMGNRFNPRGWNCSEIFGPFDIFNEDEVSGPEIVVVFCNDAWSQHAIRIYDSEGRIHYQVLFDGSCGSCLWLKDRRLLVFCSDRANVSWRERVGGPDSWSYPVVVFAIRPELHIWKDYLHVEPDEFGGEPPDRPAVVWLKCVLPADKAQYFDGWGLKNYPHDNLEEYFWIRLCVRMEQFHLPYPMGFDLACSYKGEHLTTKGYHIEDPYKDGLLIHPEWPDLPGIHDKEGDGKTLMTLGDLPPIKPDVLDERRKERARRIEQAEAPPPAGR